MQPKMGKMDIDYQVSLTIDSQICASCFAYKIFSCLLVHNYFSYNIFFIVATF